MATILNRGEIFANPNSTQAIASAEAIFETFDPELVEMTKVVDRPGEVYFSGDPITFIITINNNGDELLSGLRFTDTIDQAVNPIEGTNFIVNTTSGTITSQARNIIVDDINVPAGGNVVITITGIIA